VFSLPEDECAAFAAIEKSDPRRLTMAACAWQTFSLPEDEGEGSVKLVGHFTWSDGQDGRFRLQSEIDEAGDAGRGGEALLALVMYAR
jgi:hypothetical protein